MIHLLASLLQVLRRVEAVNTQQAAWLEELTPQVELLRGQKSALGVKVTALEEELEETTQIMQLLSDKNDRLALDLAELKTQTRQLSSAASSSPSPAPSTSAALPSSSAPLDSNFGKGGAVSSTRVLSAQAPPFVSLSTKPFVSSGAAAPTHESPELTYPGTKEGSCSPLTRSLSPELRMSLGGSSHPLEEQDGDSWLVGSDSIEDADLLAPL
jgi:uncharacterized protein YoxC